MIKHFNVISILIALCVPLHLLCGDSKTLVAFSTRIINPINHHFIQSLWGEAQLDLSYRHRPEIITLDLKAAKNPGKHYRADATQPLDIQEKIDTVYLERPITFADSTQKNKNIMHTFILNTTQNLLSGGTCIIEWHPCFKFIPNASTIYKGDMNEEQGELYVDSYLQGLNAQDPFQGTVDLEKCLLATSYALNTNKIPTTKSFRTQQYIHMQSPLINRLLDFYTAHQSESRAAIDKRLQLEMDLIKCQTRYKGYSLYISKGLNEPIQTFNNNVNRATVVLPNNLGTVTVRLSSALNFGNKDDVSTYNSELYRHDDTLFNFLWSDISVHTNGPLAIKCLENLGFRDVSLWRGTSPINGRKNVWLLRGFKK